MTPDAYAYLYDTIGNRKEASRNAVATYYCTNNLNQYKYTDDAANTCPGKERGHLSPSICLAGAPSPRGCTGHCRAQTRYEGLDYQ